jgi:hypothetical protein
MNNYLEKSMKKINVLSNFKDVQNRLAILSHNLFPPFLGKKPRLNSVAFLPFCGG